jgi:hypothetical protein
MESGLAQPEPHVAEEALALAHAQPHLVALDQVREISAEWMQEYNEERPHDTLDGMPPSVFRAYQTVGSSPLAVSP